MKPFIAEQFVIHSNRRTAQLSPRVGNNQGGNVRKWI